MLATAAGRAGLGEVEFVAEPIAAAAYFVRVHGRKLASGHCLVVYDLGGGTFDVTVVRAVPSGFEVIAADGLDDVGGLDLDAAVVQHARQAILDDLQLWRRLDWPQTREDQEARYSLWRGARAAKEQLSRQQNADLRVPLAGRDLHLTRQEFEAAARPHLDRTAELTLRMLREAGVVPERIGGVFLVGGSSRIPLAATLLHRRLRIAPTVLDGPELVVAQGSLHTRPEPPGGRVRVAPSGPAFASRGPRIPVRLDRKPDQVVGRDRLLAELSARLAHGGRPGVAALCGLGGAGKTTVALEYAYRFQDQYELVWMLHAQDNTTLLAQFHDLAQQFEEADPRNESDPVARVHAALAHRTRPWLLIFDNVRDHAAARPWLPATGLGHVLVTTQDGHWPAGQAVEVGPLRPEAAIDFLLGRAGERDRESAHAIAGDLGALPLALEQAAAYMNTTGRRLVEYLELLRTNRPRVLSRNAPLQHIEPVTATWSLALEDLAALNPGSVVLLRLLAWLAPEDIPFRLLLSDMAPLPGDLDADVATAVEALRADTLGLDDAIAGLRRYSLVGPPSDGVSVHRLVQAVTVDQLEPGARTSWRAAAAALVAAAVPDDSHLRQQWPTCARLLPHAYAVLDLTSHPMQRIADSLIAAGDYTTGKAVWEAIVEAAVTAYGPNDPQTWLTRHGHAYATGKAGDPVAARDFYVQMLAAIQQEPDAAEEDILIIGNFLARWTGEAGDPAAARNLYADLLPEVQRTFGPDDAETLNVRTCLARWIGEAGEAQRARDMFEELVPVLERVDGAAHPGTLAVRADHARWTGEAGDAAGARDLFGALLPVQEKVLGPEHVDTLDARARLATWTGQAGDAAKARNIFAALLPVQERILGRDHCETAATRNHLEHWTYAARPTLRAVVRSWFNRKIGRATEVGEQQQILKGICGGH